MKAKDIKNKTIQEITEMLKEERIKLGKLRFELSNKTLKDVSQIRKTKKDIARILTLIKNFQNQSLVK